VKLLFDENPLPERENPCQNAKTLARTRKFFARTPKALTNFSPGLELATTLGTSKVIFW
jgi:hypothetical protein